MDLLLEILGKAFLEPILSLFLWLIKSPFHLFRYIAMGSRKRKIVDEMFKEIEELNFIMSSIAYDGNTEYAHIMNYQEKAVDLGDPSEIFINHRKRLLLKARDIFEQFIKDHFTNPDGTTKNAMDKIEKETVINEAKEKVKDLSAIISSY